jgi:hypothetical protein
MNIEDGALWFNPKSEKLYQQKNAKWEEQPDFEKQNMHVPILAEEYLNRLYKIKKEEEYLKQEKLLINKKLTKYLAEGHLDYLKSSSGCITYKNKQYIPVKGRVVYDYSSDPDIAAKQKELRQLKKVAEAIGTLDSKQSPDSWRIKDVEVEQ